MAQSPLESHFVCDSNVLVAFVILNKLVKGAFTVEMADPEK